MTNSQHHSLSRLPGNLPRSASGWWLYLLCSLCAASNAIAQNENSPASTEQSEREEITQSYTRAYFDRFNPQTARDIIDRLPGFTLDAGDELRGFGANAGNVLIDGERPSSKRGGLDDALRRLPANAVERIEVIRGVAGSSDSAGQAIIANIIRAPQVRTGSWQSKIERSADDEVYGSGEITLAQQLGAWQTTSKFNAFWEHFPLNGSRVHTGPAGQVQFAQRESEPSELREAYVSSEFRRSFGADNLGVTGRFGRSEFLRLTDRTGFDDGQLDGGAADERLGIEYDSRYNDGELGIDWSSALAPNWQWKLLSLTSFQNWKSVQLADTERPLGNLLTHSLFARKRETLESVLRNTVSYSGSPRFTPEFGVELTYNKLDNQLSLRRQEQGGSSTQIDLPGADTLVEEERGEAFFNLTWSLRQDVLLETGAALEYSTIAVTGDAQNTQSFFFAKPYINLVHDYRPGLQFRLGLSRLVGQLDFNDFAASAQADQDRLLAGNPALRPDKITRTAFTTDYRTDSGIALNFELFHEWRSDVLEQLLLPSGVAGKGNAGEGRVWGAKGSLSLGLDDYLTGAILELETEVVESTFNDPLIGRERGLSNLSSPSALLEFRQDISSQQMSWGVSYRLASDSEIYFVDEEYFSREGSQWTAFIESTRISSMRINLSLRNIGTRDFSQQRRYFTANRSNPSTGTEFVERSRGMFAALTLSGQF